MNTIGIDNNLDRPRIKKLLVIGLFASFLTGIGDFILGYGAAENMEGYGLAASVLASAPNLADRLLVCTVRPAWLIIPGTENCSSYSDYGHHFKGFLIGCIYTTLMALIFAGIDYAILYFLMWK